MEDLSMESVYIKEEPFDSSVEEELPHSGFFHVKSKLEFCEDLPKKNELDLEGEIEGIREESTEDEKNNARYLHEGIPESSNFGLEDEGERNIPLCSSNKNETDLTEMNQQSKKQWDNSKDEMLIEIVKSKPELYDLASPFYSNVNVKRRSWREINKQLGCEGCKERWESLRSQYRKVIGKYTKSGQGASSTVKWKYEEQMGFLRSLSKDRTRICSTSSKELDMYETMVDDMEEVADEIEGCNVQVPEKSLIDEIVQTLANSEKPYSQPRPRKRKLQPTPSASSATLMSYILENKQSTSSDPIDTFFLSMASTVKKFNSKDKLFAKTKVFRIITEIEAQYVNQEVTPPSVSPALSGNSSIQKSTLVAQDSMSKASSCAIPYLVSPVLASNSSSLKHDSAVSENLTILSPVETTERPYSIL